MFFATIASQYSFIINSILLLKQHDNKCRRGLLYPLPSGNSIIPLELVSLHTVVQRSPFGHRRTWYVTLCPFACTRVIFEMVCGMRALTICIFVIGLDPYCDWCRVMRARAASDSCPDIYNLTVMKRLMTMTDNWRWTMDDENDDDDGSSKDDTYDQLPTNEMTDYWRQNGWLLVVGSNFFYGTIQ